MNHRILLVTSIALAAGCGGKQADKQAQAAPKPSPIAVKAATAKSRVVARSADVTGSLHPDDSTNIVSEVAGRIAAIRFDFGQSVRKGDVLVEIDRQEYQIQLDRSRAALAQALARVGLNPDQENETPTTSPMIRSARAQLEDARSKYENARKLAESGDVARERLTEAEKLVNARQAGLDLAVDDLRTGLANVRTLRADQRLFEKRLADTTVRAPFDGQISQRMAAPGQYVKDNVPLMTLVKTWPLRLQMNVPEVGAAMVKVGEQLTFTTEAIPGQTFAATVTELNPTLEARSRSLSAEARLLRPDPRLRPGMFVQVRLALGKGETVTMVPRAAVYSIAGLNKLFALSGGKAREVRFVPGRVEGEWVEVPGGVVQPGEAVALDKLNVLTDGTEVRAEHGGTPPAAAPGKGN